MPAFRKHGRKTYGAKTLMPLEDRTVKPGEEKRIRISCGGLAEEKSAEIKAELWNAEG